ncbi:hypothetical protein [Acetobacter vaccinii]|uniref:hypothetical protein n=1 Tax=Acetobacter vaccinii TaxID=2592655 RepID=UPI001FEFFA83|nr:hypothetical protein [Acetobacter vaccinii]
MSASSSTAGTTSVPAPTLTSAGFVAPAESDILTGALADMNAALGGNASTALSTPQGQLAMSFTAALGDAYDQMLALFNGVDPDRAQGRMQDAIGNLYFLSRKGASATGLGDFACTVTGAVACPAGSIALYQSVPGLTGITNPAAGVNGAEEEGRIAFEKRRAASVAANAMGFLGALNGAVRAVAGVTDAYVTDNSTAQTQVVGGVSLAPHSLYVCVNGGADADVALAILRKKPPGCAYTGATTVTVTDPDSTAAVPLRYDVSFTRATPTPVYMTVTLGSSATVPATVEQDVRAAVLAAFAVDTSATIGGTLYASAYYAAVAALGSWARVVGITLGLDPSPTGLTAQLAMNMVPTMEAATIAVVLG